MFYPSSNEVMLTPDEQRVILRVMVDRLIRLISDMSKLAGDQRDHAKDEQSEVLAVIKAIDPSFSIADLLNSYGETLSRRD